jgi:hypothetical protein
MLSALDEQEFRNVFANYQTLELDLFNTKRDLEAIMRIASRLKFCKSEAIQGDIASISNLEAFKTRISELEAMIGKRKADLIAESNARYHSQK